jgi:hypothetical protein
LLCGILQEKKRRVQFWDCCILAACKRHTIGSSTMKTLTTTPAEAAAAAAAATTVVVKNTNTDLLKHKRRYCRAEGCDRIVKSQGLCQRHGAKPKICLVNGCTKQAQGNFDGMCSTLNEFFVCRTVPPCVVCMALNSSCTVVVVAISRISF